MPFVLVEAKNTVETIGAPVVSLLVRKLQTKRGKARLGFLFAASRFSSDAEKEELRLSETQYCVVMFDAHAIEALIEAADLDEALEQHVARAMLR